MYVCKPTSKPKAKLRAQLFGSGTILAAGAQGAEDPRGEVRRRRRRVERHELRQPLSRRPRVRALEPPASGRQAARAVRDAGRPRTRPGVFVAASDYLKVLPDSIDRWLPGRCRRSAPTASAAATRAPRCATSSRSMRGSSCSSTLYALMQEKQIEPEVVAQGDQGSRHR